MTTWTEKRTAQFRDLYAQGLSHREIAAALGGISRNSCIGKAHRLGLEHRARTPKRTPWVAAGVRQRTWQRRQAKANGRAPQARRGPQRLTRYIDERIGASKPFVLDEARFVADLAAANPVTLLELQAHHCRFPVGEPGNPAKPMMYCGAAKCGEDYSSYCAAHHRLAFASPRARGGVFVFAKSGRRVA
jgi:GcrA cell cycle regulator